MSGRTTAVADDGGSKFIGTWKKINGRGPDTEGIERRGDFYVISAPKFLMPTESEQTTAQLRDGILKVNGELGRSVIHVNLTSGHMFTTHGEYVRSK